MSHGLGEGLEGQVAQALSSASLETVLHGGNLLEHVGVAVAANTVAHLVLPVDAKSGVLQQAGHAALTALTASALNASPDYAMNIAIAAVGGMVGRVVEEQGQAMGKRVVLLHREKAKQKAVFKQKLAWVSENASERLRAERGIDVPAY